MISPIRRILDRRRTQKPVDEAETLRKALKRREAIVERILAFAPLLRTLLVVAGLLYTLALPHKSLGRGHYVDENALQPGQVNTYWNWADVHVADRYADNVATWSELSLERRSRAIKEAFQELGLPAVQQPYCFDLSSTSNVSGINTYAILAAPKTDGAEALVIGASWLSRATDEAADHRINVRGVALLLAIANYFKKYSMWSKDIIFVVADGYIDGMQAWLDAYHGNGQSNLRTERLPLTTGPIWAAINLDYPHHSFSHIGLYFEGANGHLPNMDLINSASRILHHTGIQPLLHTYNPHDDAQHSLINTMSESLPEVVRSEAKTYLHGAANLFRQVALGADSRVLGPEGSFGRYRIDAIALFGVPAEGPHGFHALGRATESLFRSLNNLLERLHASVFLYLMTSVDTFISVSNYLAAPILIGAGLTVDGLITWSQASANNKSGVAQEKPVLLAMVLLGVAALVGSLEVALIARLDPQQRLPEYLSAGLLSLHLFTPLLVVNILKSPTMASLAAPQRYGVSSTSLSATVRAVVLLASGLLISITATLNFGWSLFTAVYLAIIAFLLPPLYRRYPLRRRSFRRRMQQFALALASPAGLWTLWRIGKREAAETWLQDLLRDWHVGGGWGMPVAVGLVGPLVLLQAISVQL